MGPKEMVEVANFMDRVIKISLQLQAEAGSKQLKDFLRCATEGEGEGRKALRTLEKDVGSFSRQFGLPGVDVEGLKARAE